MSELKNLNKLAIFIFLFSFIFILQTQNVYAWLDGFNYRRPINITNLGSTALTDYQVLITLNTQTLISQRKMRSDCGDIRFALPNNTLISYWIEGGCNTTSTTIWVRVPFIPANSSTTIYLYYGNPSATSLSNGDAVFDFFDDFSGTTLNTSKWNVINQDAERNTYGITSGYLWLRGNATVSSDSTWKSLWIKSLDTFTPSKRLVMNVRFYMGLDGGVHTFGFSNGVIQPDFWDDDAIIHHWRGGNANPRAVIRHNGISLASVTLTEYLRNTWYGWIRWEAIWHSTNISVRYNGIQRASSSSFTDNMPIHFGVAREPTAGAGRWTEINIDYVAVAKFTHPEPTASIGVEEERPNLPPTITIYFPQNQTYFYARNFVFNFSVSDDFNFLRNGLVLWLKFDEGSGNIAYDSSGNNNHGTIYGATWVDGKFGKALSFDGVDDYVEVISGGGLNTFTISLWIKTNESRNSPIFWQRPTIFGKSSGGAGSGDFGITTNNGYIGFWSGLVSGDASYLSSTTRINDNKWHHIVVSNDGSNARLYVDGKFEASLPTGLALNNEPFWIGGKGGSESPGFYHSGLIDEVRFYNRALSDEEIQTLYNYGLWVRAFLDGELIYENRSHPTNVTTVLVRNLSQAKSYNLTIWVNDTDTRDPKISTSTLIFTIKDFEISSVEYEQYPYETKDYNYSITFRYNPDLVRNITSRLNWNNHHIIDTNITFRNSTHIKNTMTFTLPLIQENNTQVSFRFVNTINYTNNSLQTVESNTYNQNVIFAYWIDSIASDRNDYIEFEDATIRLYVRDKVGRASLSATITFVYNSTHRISRDLFTYSTQSDLKIFNYTFDTLESFADNETRSYFANLTVSFRGDSRVMNSPVQQLRVYKIILTNCSIYPTRALTLFVKDEETDRPLLNATIEASFNVWKTGEIKRNYAWRFDLINRDNQSICIYPSWAEYYIDAMFQYYRDGYTDRTYFIFTNISNRTLGVNLYLLDRNLGNIVIIYVVDENGNKIQGAIVKIQRYYVGSNSYKTVAQVKTDYEGKGVTFLRVNEIYYRFIIERNFKVIRETEPTIIVCTTGGCPPYPVTLSIFEQKPAKYFRYIGKIAYACQVNEETNILRCTVDDTSQVIQKSRLLVEQKGALKFDTLCDNICESSACTITCDLGERTNNIYRYILSAYMPEQIVLEQNVLDYKQALIVWGTQGLLIAFLLTSTLFFVGIWNPVASISLAMLGIVAGYLLGFTPVSISSLIGLALAVGILIYKMRS